MGLRRARPASTIASSTVSCLSRAPWNKVDKEDRVRDDYPYEEQDAKERGDAKGRAGEQEGPEGAYCREWDG